MTRKLHIEEQIIAVFKDAQAWVRVQDLFWKHGISDAILYKWQTIYAGLEVSDVKKLRQGEFGQQGISQTAGRRFDPYTAHQNQQLTNLIFRRSTQCRRQVDRRKAIIFPLPAL